VKKYFRLLTAVLVLVASGLLLQGCGGDTHAHPSVRIVALTFPDSLDPGLSATSDGRLALIQAYPGLVTFEHRLGVGGSTLAPGLAQALPSVSRDGRTYRFTLRPGLRFSNGRPLRASDVKWSLSRVLLLDSPGAGLGYSEIEGAHALEKTKRGEVSGVTANDRTGRVTIRLVRPRGSFLYELALPYVGVVPRGTPATNQTQHPPPGAGLYVVDHVHQDRSFSLTRNPHFSPSLRKTAVDAGRIRRFDVRVITSPTAAVASVRRGDADYMYENPPADEVQALRDSAKARFQQFRTDSVSFFFMNSSVPPFDDVRVRRAVNLAIDKRALARLQGGQLAPANSVLSAGIPGHRNWPDLYPHSVARARALVREAGAIGARVSVWGDSAAPVKFSVEYLASTLDQVGLKTRIKILPPATYFSVVGARATRAQIGYANWYADTPHPASILDAALNPENVTANDNVNFTYNSADLGFARRIDAAAARPLDPATLKRWSELDRYVQQRAYWAIFGSLKGTELLSNRMKPSCRTGYWPPAISDWSRLCLK
jgi:peptide/nickel transport system substrate-binding protein